MDFSTCYFYKQTGKPCISCGFTRAAVSLSKGHVKESVQYNAGFIPFCIVLILSVYTLINKGSVVAQYLHKIVYFTLFILFLQWTIKLFYNQN